MIDSTGKLGTVVSSARFKNQIKPMDKASEAILALKPVTFRYEEELDPDGMPQFGLIAEEVEKVNPDLVVRDEDGKVCKSRKRQSPRSKRSFNRLSRSSERKFNFSEQAWQSRRPKFRKWARNLK
ncbi:MAG: hypothetical protein DMF23_08435 [Verrucomicrobia bacterium]|nr:MAG: hypothetical protein DMF23_08435 [Verrucomicrobiota bacterium]